MLPTFKEINSDPVKCSAWLKDRSRCCGRRLAHVDQKKQLSLLRSVAAHQEFSGDEAATSLDFSEPQNTNQRLSSEDEASILSSSTTNTMSPPVPTRPSQQNSCLRFQEPVFLPETENSLLRRSARIRAREPEPLPQAEIPTPQLSSRTRAREPETLPQVEIPTLQLSERFHAREPETLRQVEIPTPRRSERVRGARNQRPVNLNDSCPVCETNFNDPDAISRCKSCGNDLHRDCFLEWLTMPTSRQNCAFCRSHVSEDEVQMLIRRVDDLAKRERFENLFRTKKRPRIL